MPNLKKAVNCLYVLIFMLIAQMGWSQSIDLTIKTEEKRQEIWGYGASATPSWTSDFISMLSPSQKSEVLDMLFKNEGNGNCGFSIIRSRPPSRLEGETSNPDKLTHEPANDEWFWDGNTSFRELAREASSRNPEIEYMILPWSGPSWMKTSGTTKGGSLKEEHYQDFGNYLAEFVRHYRNNLNLNIVYVCPQNEPHNNTQDWDATYYTHDELGKITKIVSDSIKADFPDIKIGFSEANPKEHLKYWNATTEAQREHIDFIAYHEYEDDPETDFSAANKPVLMTEFSYYRKSFNSGKDMEAGLSWGRSIIGDLRDRGEKGKLWWSFFSDKSSDEMFIQLKDSEYRVQKRMYVQGHFSRFHGKDHVVVEVEESDSDLDVLASLSPGSEEISLTCINSSSEDKNITVTGGWKADQVTLWITNENQNLVNNGSLSVETGTVDYLVPANSVISLVEKSSSTGLNLIKYRDDGASFLHNTFLHGHGLRLYDVKGKYIQVPQ